MSFRRLLSAALFLLLSACDLVVPEGQTFVLGGRGMVFGSLGNGSVDPRPAVFVRPGATAVIEDADLLGGLLFLEREDQGFFIPDGAGIFVADGTVPVGRGLVRGGAIVGVRPIASSVGLLAAFPAIRAEDSSVEISGGTLVGGPVVPLLPGSAPAFAAPAIVAQRSTLRITGGQFLGGTSQGANPFSSLVGDSLLVFFSDVEVRGGEFPNAVTSFGSQMRISGGSFDTIVFDQGDGSACAEIRGGQIRRLNLRGRAILFGTGLIEEVLGGATSIVRGTLEDGTPLALVVGRQSPEATLRLATPGSPGCR